MTAETRKEQQTAADALKPQDTVESLELNIKILKEKVEREMLRFTAAEKARMEAQNDITKFMRDNQQEDDEATKAERKVQLEQEEARQLLRNATTKEELQTAVTNAEGLGLITEAKIGKKKLARMLESPDAEIAPQHNVNSSSVFIPKKKINNNSNNNNNKGGKVLQKYTDQEEGLVKPNPDVGLGRKDVKKEKEDGDNTQPESSWMGTFRSSFSFLTS